jgi:hypothetical protein
LAFFAKVGGDIGASYSWQLGASHVRQRTASEGVALFDYDDLSGLQNLFVGRQRISGADLVVKWAPDGNPLYRNFRGSLPCSPLSCEALTTRLFCSGQV